MTEAKYTFEDVRNALKGFVHKNRKRGYLIYSDFPREMRISRMALQYIVGEFTPQYVRFHSTDFKQSLFSDRSFRKFKNYFEGKEKVKEK